jgi:putative transposase
MHLGALKMSDSNESAPSEVCAIVTPNLARELVDQPAPSTPRQRVHGADISEIPKRLWRAAHHRLETIGPLLRKSGRTRADVGQAAQDLRCSVSWLYELLRRYGEDSRLTSFVPYKRGTRPGHSQLDAASEALVKAAIDAFYLTRQQPTMSALMVEIRRRCLEFALTAPSRRAVQRRVNARSKMEVMRARRGHKAMRDRFGAVAGSFVASRPLAVVQIDHTLVDVVIVDSNSRQPIKRPWLTLAIDVCTRCVVGFYLTIERPSATSVALCIAHSALPKAGWLAARQVAGTWPVEGIPECLHLDNGREFHSEALRRGCEQYGIALDYRPVRTPHYGGHIERLIGTVMGKVHLLPGTTFSNIAEKGDLDPDATATLTLKELEQWLSTAIVGLYHESVHRGIGTTPMSAWLKGIGSSDAASRTLPVRVPDPRRFLIDFLPVQHRLVRREGIVLNSISYWSDVLSTWIGSPEPMIIRYDPRDLSRIYMLGPDGTYYDVPYRDLHRPAISVWEHRAALAHLRAQGRSAVNEAALFGAIDTMRRITERAVTETKIIRRQRERERHLRKPSRKTLTPSADATPSSFEPPVLPNDQIFASIEEWA